MGLNDFWDDVKEATGLDHVEDVVEQGVGFIADTTEGALDASVGVVADVLTGADDFLEDFVEDGFGEVFDFAFDDLGGGDLLGNATESLFGRGSVGGDIFTEIGKGGAWLGNGIIDSIDFFTTDIWGYMDNYKMLSKGGGGLRGGASAGGRGGSLGLDTSLDDRARMARMVRRRGGFDELLGSSYRRGRSLQ